MPLVATFPNGTATIPVAFHLVALDDGTGGLSAGNVQQILDAMNFEFASINVHFCLAATSVIQYTDLYNAFILGYVPGLLDENQTPINASTYCLGNYEGLNNDSRLDIYVKPTTDLFSEGYASGHGGSDLIFDIPLDENGDVVSAAVVNHEIGHCLGLYHPFDTPLGEIPCGDSGLCCGDGMDDTPNGDGTWMWWNNDFYFFTNANCGWSLELGDPFLYSTLGFDENTTEFMYNGNWDDFQIAVWNVFNAQTDNLGNQEIPMTNNIMAYTSPGCQTGFTQAQENYIWLNITNNLEVNRFCLPDLDAVPVESIVVDSGEIVNLPEGLHLVDNISIASGGNLIINSATILLQGEATISISSGASLHATNSIFNGVNSCAGPLPWAGFDISPTLYDVTGIIISPGGSLVMDHCIVENATRAIHSGAFLPPFVLGPGEIVVSNSRLYNNEIDVELGGQVAFYPLIQNTPEITFENCRFESFTGFQEVFGHPKQHFMDAVGSSLFTLRHCHFSNTTGTTDNLVAISNLISPFVCESATGVESDGTSTTYSIKVDGCNYGVQCFSTTIQPGYPRIDGAIVNVNMGRCVYLEGCVDAEITNSTLNAGNFYSEPGYGLYLNNCTGYTVEDNFISGSAQNGDFDDYTGIYVRESGNAPNTISSNSLGGHRHNIACLDNNTLIDIDTNTGLQLQCNQHSSGQVSEWVGESTVVINDVDYEVGGDVIGISHDQGSAVVGSGNFFLGASQSHYQNYGDDEITYWWFAPAGLEFIYQPSLNVEGIDVSDEQSDGPPQCQLFQIMDEEDDADLEAQLNNIKGEIYNYQQQLESLLDGGNTEELISDVIYTSFSDAIALTYELLSHSPYLSEEVLKEAIERYDLPNALLLLILEANPHVAGSGQLRDRMDDRLVPFSEFERALIMQGLGVITEKDRLESNVNHYTHQAAMYINELARRHFAAGNLAAIISLLLGEEAIEYRYELATMQFFSGNRTAAEATLADIYVERFPVAVQLNHERALEYFDLYMDLQEQHMQITPNQLVQLRELASLDIGIVAGWSRTLLRFYEPAEYHEPLEDPNAELRFAKVDMTSFPPTELSIYPNPSPGLMMLQLNRTYLHIQVVEIMDALGQVVLTQQFAQSSQPLLNLSTLSNGMYQIRTTLSDNSVVQGHAILQKH